MKTVVITLIHSVLLMLLISTSHAKENKGGGTAPPALRQVQTACLCADTITSCLAKTPAGSVIQKITFTGNFFPAQWILFQVRETATPANTWVSISGRPPGDNMEINTFPPTNNFNQVATLHGDTCNNDAVALVTAFSYIVKDYKQ